MKMGGKEPDCLNCAYCGADMDLDAWCAHPSLDKEFPLGKYLYTGIEHCLKDGKLTLYERHE